MAKQLKSLLDSWVPSNHRWKIKLFTQWNQIIGPISKNITIEKIENDILYLAVPNSSLAQELHFLSSKLKKTINKHLGQNKINTIRIRHQTIRRKNPFRNRPANSPKKQTDKALTTVALNSNEQKTLEPLCSTSLKSVFENYFIRCKNQRRKSGKKKQDERV